MGTQVKFLGTLLEADEDLEGRDAWVQETLALLEPAAQRNRMVAHMLANHIAIFCRLLTVSSEPLSLSLGEGSARRRAASQSGSITILINTTCKYSSFLICTGLIAYFLPAQCLVPSEDTVVQTKLLNTFSCTYARQGKNMLHSERRKRQLECTYQDSRILSIPANSPRCCEALLLAGLDIFEEVLVNGEERRTARRLADQGALAALVYSLIQHGL